MTVKEQKALPPPDNEYYENLAPINASISTISRFNVLGGIRNLAYVGDYAPVYGYDQKKRDFWLRWCVRNVSWLSSVVRNVGIRLETIPYEIRAKNASVISHVEQGKHFDDVFWNGHPLISDSEGWADVKGRFINDILTQDNGGILEILDSPENLRRKPKEPRIGFGGFRYWDSEQVIRKKHNNHPVTIEYKAEGEDRVRQYSLHRTRVFSIVDMESGDFYLNGIGFCATSRAIDFFRGLKNLTDTLDENYGDGEPDQIWKLTSNSIPQVADGERFLDKLEAKYHISRSNGGTVKTAKRLKIELPVDSKFETENARTLPDSFDETSTITNGMTGMAAAFNVPLRFVWTIASRGLGDAAAADLDEQIAESGMFTWLSTEVKKNVVQKVIPPTLEIITATTNDKEDLQKSEIEENITSSSSQQLVDGAIDIRTYRLKLLDSGNMSESEFIRLELEDGRLRDGKAVVDKFYDSRFTDVLSIDGVTDPLDVATNASQELIDSLGDRAREVKRQRELILDDGRRVTERERLTIAHTALTRLQRLYIERIESLEEDTTDNRPEQDTGEQSEDSSKKKSISDDLDLYERKLEQILLRANSGEIEEDDAQERIEALAQAMLLIAYLLGRRQSPSRMTPDELVVFNGARDILNNGGITAVDFTDSQLQRFNEGLATVNDTTNLNAIFSDEELGFINGQIDINRDSALGVVEFAVGLTATLSALGLTDRAFDSELRKRLLNRVAIWKGKAQSLVEVGKVAIAPLTLFRWDINPTQDNCVTCLGQNQQIRTGAEWFQLAITQKIYPRGSGLACGGWRCGCQTRRVQNQ